MQTALHTPNLWITAHPAADMRALETGLAAFVARPQAYKLNFLQKNYSKGFDGYSFHGQTDSTNQAHDDMVDSFVLSDYHRADEFPMELQYIRGYHWQEIKPIITALETEIIQLYMPELAEFYTNNMVHMLSANYYPPVKTFRHTASDNTRLSEHTDISFLTVFPYGVDSGIEYFDENTQQWQALGEVNQAFVFPGFLAELLTNGRVKALKHRVMLPESGNTERFSFAYFSLPKLGSTFTLFENHMPVTYTTEQYFKKYLALYN